MKKLFLITSLFFFIGCHNIHPILVKSEDDDFYEKSRKLVLSENQIDQEFFF